MKLELALEKLYTKALKFLSSSSRTEEELRKRLIKYSVYVDLDKEDVTGAIDTIVERFIEEGFINDARYAKDVVLSITSSSKPRGQQYIKSFLFKKGIPKALIDDALSSISSEDQYEKATQLITKKLQTTKYKDSFDAKKKLWGLLIRRGFTSDIASRAIDNVLGVK